MNWWERVGDTVQPMAIRNHAPLDVLKQKPFIWLMILSQQFWRGSVGQFSQPQRGSFIHLLSNQSAGQLCSGSGWLSAGKTRAGGPQIFHHPTD